jgi:hypothetical protein
MKKILKTNYLKSLVLLFLFGVLNQGFEYRTKIDNSIEGDSVMATHDVKEVMEAHAAALMAIPGVVGVYTGVLDDGTPCIKVMVENRTPELEQKIPQNLEGFPVLIEETGKIEPLSQIPGRNGHL